MPQSNIVIGIGRSPEEALLYARVNQSCYDNGIKDNTISKKTDFIEVPKDVEIDGSNLSSKIIMAIHFASGYYKFQQSAIDNGCENDLKFTESEYKYYSILVRELGLEKFKLLMKCYFNKIPETCIAVRSKNKQYRFMY
jgi:hypothetical protein